MKFHDESNVIYFSQWFEKRSLDCTSVCRVTTILFVSPTPICFVRSKGGSRNERCSFDEMNWFIPDVIPRVRVRMDVIVVSSSKRGDHSRCVTAQRKGRRKAEEKTRKEGEHLD